jgi:hypothetical protein
MTQKIILKLDRGGTVKKVVKYDPGTKKEVLVPAADRTAFQAGQIGTGRLTGTVHGIGHMLVVEPIRNAGLALYDSQFGLAHRCAKNTVLVNRDRRKEVSTLVTAMSGEKGKSERQRLMETLVDKGHISLKRANEMSDSDLARLAAEIVHPNPWASPNDEDEDEEIEMEVEQDLPVVTGRPAPKKTEVYQEV